MERYVTGMDFNTKDYFVYDNKTNTNVCWCETEEEAEQFVKTMEDLQNTIIGNIDWFWGNDGMPIYETDMEKLWNGFKIWCVQNCMENFSSLAKYIVEKVVSNNYDLWLERK